MMWRAKAFAKNVVSVLNSPALDFACQKFVTKTLPRSREKIREAVEVADDHRRAVEPYLPRPLQDCVFYEFGAGWDLAGPLALWSFGVEHQVLIDLQPVARPVLINAAIEMLPDLLAPYRTIRVPAEKLPSAWPLQALRSLYGIEYIAPCDASATPLPGGSVDCIVSSHTLEHVPAADIPLILAECSRILRHDGLLSGRIDYQDHYSYSDPAIGPYNFLRFSENEWRRYSPPSHFQNRLRHRDYLDLFADTGLLQISDSHPAPSEWDLNEFARLARKHPPGLATEDGAIRFAHVVYRRP